MGFIIEVLAGTVILGIVVIGAFILLGVKLIKGDSRESPEERQAEARMIQEMYQGLNRMEQRLEALETILLDGEDQDEGEHDATS